MRSAREITTTDVQDTEPTTVNIGQTLSKVHTVMAEEQRRVIPVVDGKKFVGMLSYHDVIEKLRSDPSSTKLDGLVHTPPSISPDQNLIDLALERMNSGRKLFAVLGKHNRLDGVIGEQDIIKHALDTEELHTASVSDLMTTDLVTVTASESHETARKKMQDHSVSRLPVVDDDGEVVGLITSTDILQAMVPREQMSDGDYKHHKESMSDIPVSELMQDLDRIQRLLISEDADLREVFEAMLENDRSEAIVVAGDRPVGILTFRDAVEHLAGFEAVEQLEVQLTGLDVPQEQEAVLDKIETAVRGGLGRVMTRPQKLSLRAKKYEQEGKRHKHSLTFKYEDGEQGITNVDTHDWDLLNAVDEGLDELESILKKKKGKQITQSRKEDRERKYQ